MDIRFETLITKESTEHEHLRYLMIHRNRAECSGFQYVPESYVGLPEGDAKVWLENTQPDDVSPTKLPGTKTCHKAAKRQCTQRVIHS